MRDAQILCRHLGYVAKSKSRDRQPKLEEPDRIMVHFHERCIRRPSSAPMDRMTAFAIFSTRRQEEITNILK